MISLRGVITVLGAIALLADADVYLQNPRGSNNRLNERGRARNNANRLFDSQNNNRGGYNVGNLRYYAGSKLPIQWTNQHSCNDPNNNCEIIIQYMCGVNLRDGTTTSRIPDNERACKKNDCNTDARFGMHEDFNYYQTCKNTKRNERLFTADQKLKGKTSQFTRQNPQGTRRGYECPEERDYYPHWNPNQWKDIAVLTNDVSRCAYYQRESQNVKSRWACDVPETYLYRIRRGRKRRLRNNLIPITKTECEAITGAKWKEFPAHNIAQPDCQQSPWSRDNHNGNGRNGYMNIYNWTIPNIEEENCTLRIRYNISTNDYDTWNTFSDKNGENGQTTKVDISGLVGLNADEATKRGYVFKNNPVIQPLSSTSKFKLRIALNTAQYGRTFQDRSFTFSIEKPPKEMEGKTIYNLNVRGKRGNIVQVYPAVEYDYVPNTLVVNTGDYIHFQWTGSNTNPGNNAGQGRRGTDRSNVILLEKQAYDEGKPKSNEIHGQFGRNYPRNINEDTILGFNLVDSKKLAFLQPGSGDELNDASVYFDLGPTKVTMAGTYYYMCTRNNNFSNRSQKGKIVVKSGSADPSIKSDSDSWADKTDDVKKKEADDGTEEKSVKDSALEDENDSGKSEKSYETERMSLDVAQDVIAKQGGSLDIGDGYASDFISVKLNKKIEKDNNMWLDIPLKKDVDANTITVYYSKDSQAWQAVEAQDIPPSGDIARVKLSSDGIYVARYVKDNGESVSEDDAAIEETSEAAWSIDQ